MPTRAEIRQTLGHSLGEMIVGTVTAASGTNTIRSTALIDSIESPSRLVGAWFYVPEINLERRIAEYKPDIGEVSFSRDPQQTISLGSTFEIHQLLPASEINRLINAALSGMHYATEIEINVVPGQRQYDLSTFPYLLSTGQVYGVMLAVSDTAGQTYTEPLIGWHVERNENQLVLEVPPITSGVGSTLRVQIIRPYDEVEDETTEIDVPMRWIQANLRPLVYERLMRRAPAEDAARYQREWTREMANRQALAYHYTPTPARPIFLRKGINHA